MKALAETQSATPGAEVQRKGIDAAREKPHKKRAIAPRITCHTPPDELPVWLTVDEVAIYTCRNATSLRNSMGKGRCAFPARKIGGRWYINRVHLMEEKVERHFGHRKPSKTTK